MVRCFTFFLAKKFVHYKLRKGCSLATHVCAEHSATSPRGGGAQAVKRAEVEVEVAADAEALERGA